MNTSMSILKQHTTGSRRVIVIIGSTKESEKYHRKYVQMILLQEMNEKGCVIGVNL